MRQRIFLVALLAALASAGVTVGVGPRGGGGGGGGGGRGGGGARPSGGGGARPAPQPANRGGGGMPSMSHGARPAPRPSGGGARPGIAPGGRPNAGGARPNARPPQANRPPQMNRPAQANRPGAGATRPVRPNGGVGSGLVPQQRPGGGLGAANRPGVGTLPGISQRPAAPGGIGGNRPGLIPQPRPSNPIAGGGLNRPGGLSQLPARPGGGLAANRPGGPTQLPARPGFGDNRPGLPIRPGIGDNRPGIGDNRPGLDDGNRPGRPNRPGDGGWRPGDNNRPGWRPGDNTGNNWWANRPPVANRPGNGFNQWNQYNNNYVAGYGGYGSGGYGYGYPSYGYGGYYSQPYYEGWYHGSWDNWSYPLVSWASGAAASTAVGWFAAADNSFVYSNPYYEVPATTIVQPVYNYAEPIAVPVPVEQPDQTVIADVAPLAATDPGPAPAVIAPSAVPPPDADTKVKAAGDAFAAARAAFKAGDYARAQAEDERAIAAISNDPVLHEFRALTLFAQGKYRDAAATLYAVLARGPGWDWETMRSLYPDADTYTRQLRALEAYIRDHPTDGAARFVLAYQYLATRQTDAAVRQLREVVRLTPDNALAADMVKALTTPSAGAAPPAPGQ
jgi:hypothetical protein